MNRKLQCLYAVMWIVAGCSSELRLQLPDAGGDAPPPDAFSDGDMEAPSSDASPQTCPPRDSLAFISEPMALSPNVDHFVVADEVRDIDVAMGDQGGVAVYRVCPLDPPRWDQSMLLAQRLDRHGALLDPRGLVVASDLGTCEQERPFAVTPVADGFIVAWIGPTHYDQQTIELAHVSAAGAVAPLSPYNRTDQGPITATGLDSGVLVTHRGAGFDELTVALVDTESSRVTHLQRMSLGAMEEQSTASVAHASSSALIAWRQRPSWSAGSHLAAALFTSDDGESRIESIPIRCDAGTEEQPRCSGLRLSDPVALRLPNQRWLVAWAERGASDRDWAVYGLEIHEQEGALVPPDLGPSFLGSARHLFDIPETSDPSLQGYWDGEKIVLAAFGPRYSRATTLGTFASNLEPAAAPVTVEIGVALEFQIRPIGASIGFFWIDAQTTFRCASFDPQTPLDPEGARFVNVRAPGQHHMAAASNGATDLVAWVEENREGPMVRAAPFAGEQLVDPTLVFGPSSHRIARQRPLSVVPVGDGFLVALTRSALGNDSAEVLVALVDAQGQVTHNHRFNGADVVCGAAFASDGQEVFVAWIGSSDTREQVHFAFLDPHHGFGPESTALLDPYLHGIAAAVSSDGFAIVANSSGSESPRTQLLLLDQHGSLSESRAFEHIGVSAPLTFSSIIGLSDRYLIVENHGAQDPTESRHVSAIVLGSASGEPVSLRRSLDNTNIVWQRTETTASAPALAADGCGALVLWPTPAGIRGMRFDRAGTPLGAAWTAEGDGTEFFPTGSTYPAVTAVLGGEYLVFASVSEPHLRAHRATVAAARFQVSTDPVP